jgi:hypothetical protein
MADQRQDGILDTWEIASYEDLAKSAGLNTETVDEKSFGRIEGRQEIVIKPTDHDLGPFDQFNLDVYAGPNASGTISIHLKLNTTTEGLSTPDAYSSGVATKIDFEGWHTCVFPYENFLIFGCPEGWVGVDEIVIQISAGGMRHLEGRGDGKGIVGVGDLRMTHRDRVVGTRLTDAGLFAELDLEMPGLAEVKSAVNTSDWETAKDRLLAYFGCRQEPWHPFSEHLEADPTYDRAGADRTCDHFILNQQLPETFDWRINPIGYLEWMHALNRHTWMQPLIAAYEKTGDEKYARKLDYLLDTWMDQNPEPIDHNGGGDPAWETLSTSIRPRKSWLDVWFKLWDSPSFRPETRIKLLKSLWAHAEHLTRHEGYRNNWFIVESETIAALGVILPEFKRARVWRDDGYRRLAEGMSDQVWPDGAQYEISAGYHAMSGRGFELPYELAKHNNLPVAPLIGERLEKMYEYTAWTVRPDFSHPSINDSGGVSDGQAEWALKGADIFNRDDLRWVGSRGKQGDTPATASRMFEDAGIYVMRSGWDPDARYLVYDAGPYSAAHQHEDKLSFEFCYGSDPLIVDPGIASYMPEPWTEYYRRTEAHNTIMIDGRGQASRSNQTWDDWTRSVRDSNTAVVGKGIDYGIGRHEAGYEGVEETVHHERAILFIKPDYYLIFDRVSGEGTHDIDALFHFMPIRVHIDRSRVRTDREGQKNVEVVPLDAGSRLRPKLITGQTNPVQGWISNRENMPAPCAVYRKTGVELPATFGWVIAPFGSGRSAGLTVRKVPAEGGHAFQLRWATGERDTVYWSWNPGSGSFGSYETDATGAIVRQVGRKVTYACAIEGTRLSGSGIDLRGERGCLEVVS